MPNIREIASESGVSIATVSRVLNNTAQVSEPVRQRVMDVVQRRNYVARVGRRSTTNVAYLFTGRQTLYSPYDAQIMAGMNLVMDDYPFDLLVLHAQRSRRPQETLNQLFVRKNVRGAVVRTTSETRDQVMELVQARADFVVVGDRFQEPGVTCIDADSRPASRAAVEHLIKLGHTRIAMASNLIDDTDHDDRIAGWREAMEAAGLDTTGLLMKEYAHREGGAAVLERMLALPNGSRPTAVYLADPDPTVGLLHAATQRGIHVPDDLSVIGFDDANLRYLTSPMLSTVHQSAFDVGRTAASRLVEQLHLSPSETPIHERDAIEASAPIGPILAEFDPQATTATPTGR